MKKKAEKKRTAHKIQTDYLGRVYSTKYLKLIPEAVRVARRLKRELGFDAIAFSGSSGAALAFPLSFFLKVPLIHVRKGRSHYSNGTIEGTISSKKYLIVDDFIDGGTTMRRIIRNIKSELNKARPVGICLYESERKNNFSYQGKEIPVYIVKEE